MIDGYGWWIVAARLAGTQQLHASWRTGIMLLLRFSVASYTRDWKCGMSVHDDTADTHNVDLSGMHTVTVLFSTF